MPEIPEFHSKKIVRPRKNGTSRLYSITAVYDQETLSEDGEILTRNQFFDRLPMSVPSIVATQSSPALLADLCDRYGKAPNWQWKCSSREREILLPGEGEVTVCQIDTIVHFFGWKDAKKKAHRYHIILDPIVFYGRSLRDIGYDHPNQLVNLMRWALQVRGWCNDNQITVKPTIGGTSSQFLRDSRFYPADRRKVPAKTNSGTRERLPGNHYYCDISDSKREHTGTYIDQTRAHHFHARNTKLPCANSLYAYGDFQGLERVCFTNSDLGENFSGLLYGRLNPPSNPGRYGDFIELDSKQSGFWLTSEWPYLKDNGYNCSGIIAAWGSTELDTGLAKYSKWAESELDKYANAGWIKPILLATYGILASRPREIQFIFHKAKNGRPISIPAGRKELHGYLCGGTSGRKIEPSTSNVLHRALIESATRAESVGLAEWLEWKGYRILSIYADAVIIEPSEDLPAIEDIILPEPWRVKQTLNHLRFINTQAFVSGEMTKLPGTIGRTEALAVSFGTLGTTITPTAIEEKARRKNNESYAA